MQALRRPTGGVGGADARPEWMGPRALFCCRERERWVASRCLTAIVPGCRRFALGSELQHLDGVPHVCCDLAPVFLLRLREAWEAPRLVPQAASCVCVMDALPCRCSPVAIRHCGAYEPHLWFSSRSAKLSWETPSIEPQAVAQIENAVAHRLPRLVLMRSYYSAE